VKEMVETVTIENEAKLRRILQEMSKTQHKILRFIVEFEKSHGIAPQQREIIEGIEKAPTTIKDNVMMLTLRQIAYKKKLKIYRQLGGRPPMTVSATPLGEFLYQYAKKMGFKPYT